MFLSLENKAGFTWKILEVRGIILLRRIGDNMVITKQNPVVTGPAIESVEKRIPSDEVKKFIRSILPAGYQSRKIDMWKIAENRVNCWLRVNVWEDKISTGEVMKGTEIVYSEFILLARTRDGFVVISRRGGGNNKNFLDRLKNR